MHKPNINLLSNLYIFFLHSFFFLPLPPILVFFFLSPVCFSTYLHIFVSVYLSCWYLIINVDFICDFHSVFHYFYASTYENI